MLPLLRGKPLRSGKMLARLRGKPLRQGKQRVRDPTAQGGVLPSPLLVGGGAPKPPLLTVEIL